jgi:hypothetical protein
MSNRGRIVATAVLGASLLASCGGTPATSIAPTPVPTPLITPDPHLTEPASVDDVLRHLSAAGLRITANTASAGPGGEPIKRVNATYADWPLVATQFSSSAALREVGRFDPAVKPRLGESPYIIVGLNIMIEYGPHSTNDRTPAPPGEAQRKAAEALVAALDPLLGPLLQRSTQPLVLPTGRPAATPAAGGPASAPPSATASTP